MECTCLIDIHNFFYYSIDPKAIVNAVYRVIFGIYIYYLFIDFSFIF